MTIFILDDDPILSRALSKQLASWGHAVVGALSLEELSKASQIPQLMIVDFNLGGTTALVIAPKLEARWPGVPRVLLTATWLSDAEEAGIRAAGFREIMRKPWLKDDLLQLLARYGP
jgi:CheY-like chemotaxis protein